METQPLEKVSNSAFCVYGLCIVLSVNSDYFLKLNQLIFVMVKCCVLFEVRIELLNII
jgi:hypothetical protein